MPKKYFWRNPTINQERSALLFTLIVISAIIGEGGCRAEGWQSILCSDWGDQEPPPMHIVRYYFWPQIWPSYAFWVLHRVKRMAVLLRDTLLEASLLSIYCAFPWKLCRDSISKPIIQIFRSFRRDGKQNILIHKIRAIVRIWQNGTRYVRADTHYPISSWGYIQN